MKNFRFLILLLIAAAFFSMVACDIPNQEISPIDTTNANVTTIDNPLPGDGEDDSDDKDDDDGEDDNDDGDGEDDDDN